MYIKSAAVISFSEPSQCGTVELTGMPVTRGRMGMERLENEVGQVGGKGVDL